MHPRNRMAGLVAALCLAGCVAPQGPVEVTRFVEPASAARLGQVTIFVESAPGGDAGSLADGPYKAAVARELVRLGYRETARADADAIALVRLDKVRVAEDERRRGPVSVGVGGSTGSYGSGVGVGVGLNLGGGREKATLSTELGVMIRDKTSGATFWEGRAQFLVSPNSRFADTSANASAMADALFRDFPGNNGESTVVRVKE